VVAFKAVFSQDRWIERHQWKKGLCDLALLSLPSSHNWNTLFVGTNAVADAVAQKYNASKSQVLDHVSWVIDWVGWEIVFLSVSLCPQPAWSFCTTEASVYA